MRNECGEQQDLRLMNSSRNIIKLKALGIRLCPPSVLPIKKSKCKNMSHISANLKGIFLCALLRAAKRCAQSHIKVNLKCLK